MPSYKLRYFDVAGFAEIPRLLFTAAGVDFEDIRYPLPHDEAAKANWEKVKQDVPIRLGKVPVLEFDGKQLHQSNAIIHYIASTYGLLGKDVLEQAQIYEVHFVAQDIAMSLVKMLFEKDAERKKEILKELTGENGLPKLFNSLQILLENKDFYFDGKISLADISVFNIMQNWICRNEELKPLATKYPKLMELVKRVAQSEKIAAYLAKQKK